MSPETRNPTAGRRQGFRMGIGSQAISDPEVTSDAAISQASISARWLARRAGLSLSVASAIASANAWGGVLHG